jgi:hypothetical protein
MLLNRRRVSRNLTRSCRRPRRPFQVGYAEGRRTDSASKEKPSKEKSTSQT